MVSIGIHARVAVAILVALALGFTLMMAGGATQVAGASGPTADAAKTIRGMECRKNRGGKYQAGVRYKGTKYWCKRPRRSPSR
jgi:hypothetical protein